MKHFYLVTLYGYTDDGRDYYPTGFAGCDESDQQGYLSPRS